MNPHNEHKERAKQAARHDRGAGLNCNPERYSALPGSAWAKWYTDEYNHPTTGGGNDE